METLRVDVPLGDRSYAIHIAPGLLAQAGTLLREHVHRGRVLVIADERVALLHGKALMRSLADGGIRAELATFPPGEMHKNIHEADLLWRRCAEAHIDRGDTILAFGGGVCGDLAGFVASAWMRGVRFVQMPTTLLAMVDSSVGGKTGVNGPAGKNLIGAFKQPCCVIIDPALLATMDPREYRAGLAEVLKYGVIRDPEFFAWQEANATALANANPAAIAHAVAESCRIKAFYVGEDEFEKGVRAHLNYGHTFGHALERQTEYTRYLHGEAVAIGMRMAECLARSLGMLRDHELARRQDALIDAYRLPRTHACSDPLAEAHRLVDHCRVDKKVSGGRTRFVLPARLGQVTVRESPDPQLVIEAFRSGLTGAIV
ncbi:MAG: 3-dehydroquinate synthase [Planctomycetes bacterium]|nr:3-dehydroquinate synthase [Planctomycetota bacterium]